MRNFELEEAIRAAPADLDGYEVYADWLLERGEAHGEAILFAVRRRRDPTSSPPSMTEIAAEARLLRDRRRILGALGDFGREEVELDYDLGFVRAVRIYARGERAALALRHALPHRVTALLDSIGVLQKSSVRLPHVREDRKTAAAIWSTLREIGIPRWVGATALPLLGGEIEGQLDVLAHVRHCTFPYRTLSLVAPALHRLRALAHLAFTASSRPSPAALDALLDHAPTLARLPRLHLAFDPPFNYDRAPLHEALPNLSFG